MSYEVHITLEGVPAPDLDSLRLLASTGGAWVSSFTDDEGMPSEPGSYFLTFDEPTFEQACAHMFELSRRCLERGFQVVRRKVEKIVLDERIYD